MTTRPKPGIAARKTRNRKRGGKLSELTYPRSAAEWDNSRSPLFGDQHTKSPSSGSAAHKGVRLKLLSLVLEEISDENTLDEC